MAITKTTMIAYGIPADGGGGCNDGAAVATKNGDGDFGVGKLMTVPRPALEDYVDEYRSMALIRVLRAGVCNTDLEILKGYMGFKGVLGHEFVGVVEEVLPRTKTTTTTTTTTTNGDSTADDDDDDAKKLLGKRVCGDINVACQRWDCIVCQKQYDGCCSQMSRNHCPNRTVLGILNHHGTMSEYLVLPVRNLHVVPDHVSDAVAVFAEPLAAAIRIVEQDIISYPDNKNEDTKTTADRVAVLGDGKLGLMIGEVVAREHVRHYGMPPTDGGGGESKNDRYPQPPVLFGKHRDKLDLLSNDVAGIETKLVSDLYESGDDGGGGNNGGATMKSSYASSFDVVVDATGNPSGLQGAIQLCRPMGKIVLKSTCAAGEQFNTAPFVIDELIVVGSRCGPIHKALDMLSVRRGTATTCEDAGAEQEQQQQPMNVEKYITKTFPLKEAHEAIQFASLKSTMKVQIVCSDDNSN